jgi:hypothetical protein
MAFTSGAQTEIEFFLSETNLNELREHLAPPDPETPERNWFKFIIRVGNVNEIIVEYQDERDGTAYEIKRFTVEH